MKYIKIWQSSFLYIKKIKIERDMYYLWVATFSLLFQYYSSSTFCVLLYPEQDWPEQETARGLCCLGRSEDDRDAAESNDKPCFDGDILPN